MRERERERERKRTRANQQIREARMDSGMRLQPSTCKVVPSPCTGSANPGRRASEKKAAVQEALGGTALGQQLQARRQQRGLEMRATTATACLVLNCVRVCVCVCARELGAVCSRHSLNLSRRNVWTVKL